MNISPHILEIEIIPEDPLVILMRALRNTEDNLDSPIDINIGRSISIELPVLTWYNYDVVPKKIKFTNSGFTALLSAKYFEERPYLIGGPLIGEYVFSQLHFHWGCNDMEGSEHSVDGTRYPVEMHVVHFKQSYFSQELALLENDGIVIVVYFFKLESKPDPYVQVLLNAFENIQQPHTSLKLKPAFPLDMLLRPFNDDYLIYWGNITTMTKLHEVLWIICRTPFSISEEQIQTFRTLHDIAENPMVRNFRDLKYDIPKQIYHVNPSATLYSTLLPPLFGRDL